MTRKPKRLGVLLEAFFKVRPEIVDFGLKPAMHFPDRFGDRRECVCIGTNVVPFTRFGPAANNDAIVFVLKPIRL